uniref:Uncharacterized protein n=1 Tax=Vespula pensylvanica TaxID=30213 RepID=A0A834N805_VESPE|nr:hypothetical protein H0235_016277 [Vespula pensylvanica]
MEKPFRTDNSIAAKCSGQTNSQLKFRLHDEHTCISCSTTDHCAMQGMRESVSESVDFSFYEKIGCLRATLLNYLSCL